MQAVQKWRDDESEKIQGAQYIAQMRGLDFFR
jgi:hypothetical protein